MDEVNDRVGADAHKRSHTIAAVSATTGELVGERTVQVGAKGFAALLVWARGLEGERVWAIEDCRHVSGSLERFLIGRGERVLRVTTKLMARAAQRSRPREVRQHRRRRGRPGGAARGLDVLPAAQLDGPEQVETLRRQETEHNHGARPFVEDRDDHTRDREMARRIAERRLQRGFRPGARPGA